MEGLRLLAMLKQIPSGPGRVTVKQLAEHLNRVGYSIDKRSIERDLQSLMKEVPLRCDDRNRPYGWYLERGRFLSLPGLSLTQAVTFYLAEQQFKHLMPPSAIAELQPFFDQARQQLRSAASTPTAKWSNKIRLIPPAQPLLGPKIRHDVQNAVFEALLKESQLDIVYQHRGNPKEQRARIHPLAVVQRGWMIYLVAGFFDYEDPRTLALHRIKQAKILDEAARIPLDFSIDQFIEAGGFGFGSSKRIRLQALFYDGAGQHLEETPLTTNQKLVPMGDDSHKLTAAVILTEQLKWWLLGFGDRVEVVRPTALRTEIAGTLHRALGRYRATTRDRPRGKNRL